MESAPPTQAENKEVRRLLERVRVGEVEIDEAVSEWTAHQHPAGLQSRLQVHGIAAHEVSNAGEVLTDPQLVHRNHFSWVPQTHIGLALVDNPPYHLSRSSGGFDWAGPSYGEHAMEVFEEILGYDGDRIAELAIAGALE